MFMCLLSDSLSDDVFLGISHHQTISLLHQTISVFLHDFHYETLSDFQLRILLNKNLIEILHLLSDF